MSLGVEKWWCVCPPVRPAQFSTCVFLTDEDQLCASWAHLRYVVFLQQPVLSSSFPVISTLRRVIRQTDSSNSSSSGRSTIFFFLSSKDDVLLDFRWMKGRKEQQREQTYVPYLPTQLLLAGFWCLLSKSMHTSWFDNSHPKAPIAWCWRLASLL